MDKNEKIGKGSKKNLKSLNPTKSMMNELKIHTKEQILLLMLAEIKKNVYLLNLVIIICS